MAAPLSVLYLSDGRAGHRSQALGLQAGLARAGVPVQWQELPVSALSPWALAAWALTAGRLGHCPGTQPPQVLLGVGHRTHWPLLWLKKIFPRSFALVIMKPSLPLGWFDGVMAPAHDGLPAHPHVLSTPGVLNPLVNEQRHAPDRGLLLIGGPSRRYGWDSAALWPQIVAVLERVPEVTHWVLTTSRRTPADFLDHVPVALSGRLQVMPVAQTPAGWLNEQLQQASQVWVTEDSMSMLHEALTAGAQVGVLPVPRLRADRITAAVDQWRAQGLVQSVQQAGAGQATVWDNAADRAAAWLLAQLASGEQRT